MNIRKVAGSILLLAVVAVGVGAGAGIDAAADESTNPGLAPNCVLDIENLYAPFLARVPGSQGVTPEAAVALLTHDLQVSGSADDLLRRANLQLATPELVGEDYQVWTSIGPDGAEVARFALERVGSNETWRVTRERHLLAPGDCVTR